MATAATVETRLLEGRDHFVTPCVMLAVGVWPGSQGPIYYPESELRDTAHLWNAKPVVVFHPAMGTSGYAGHPDVFNRQRIGTVFNTRFEDGRLRADAWIDVARVEIVDVRVLHAISNRRVLEVSTGLGMDLERRSGVFNGRDFHAIARYLHPDHLAVLPDQRGAYSVADGAGLLRNQAYIGGSEY